MRRNISQPQERELSVGYCYCYGNAVVHMSLSDCGIRYRDTAARPAGIYQQADNDITMIEKRGELKINYYLSTKETRAHLVLCIVGDYSMSGVGGDVWYNARLALAD